MQTKQITATDIAYCGGMAAARRGGWTKHGLRAQPPFSEFDAVETAVAKMLADKTNQKRATAAFKQLQPELREAVMAGRTQLWAVVPYMGHGVTLATSSAKAFKIAMNTEGPLWIVALKKGIEIARERYTHKKTDIESAGSGLVHQLPSQRLDEKN
jgi:hypothetical protein